MGEYSKEAKKTIKEKLEKMSEEGSGRPRKQQIAIAISEAKRKGYKVPSKK